MGDWEEYGQLKREEPYNCTGVRLVYSYHEVLVMAIGGDF